MKKLSKRKAAKRNTGKDRGYKGIGNGAEFAASYLQGLRKDSATVRLSGCIDDLIIHTKDGTPEDQKKRVAFADVIERALVSGLDKPDLVNELGVIFEALRTFTYKEINPDDGPHKTLFLTLLCDRGDKLLGLNEDARHD